MQNRQKAMIVMTSPERSHGLDELNIALGRGWRVVKACPMGGASKAGSGSKGGVCFAALVVLEQHDHEREEGLALTEEEEAIDELLEGDGAGVDVDEEFA